MYRALRVLVKGGEKFPIYFDLPVSAAARLLGCVRIVTSVINTFFYSFCLFISPTKRKQIEQNKITYLFCFFFINLIDNELHAKRWGGGKITLHRCVGDFTHSLTHSHRHTDPHPRCIHFTNTDERTR